MHQIIQTKQFKRDYKKIVRSGCYKIEDFLQVIDLLSTDKLLPNSYHDHFLAGKWEGHKECHIKPDWLLI